MICWVAYFLGWTLDKQWVIIRAWYILEASKIRTFRNLHSIWQNLSNLVGREIGGFMPPLGGNIRDNTKESCNFLMSPAFGVTEALGSRA